MTEYCCECGASIDIVLVEYSEILHDHLVCNACAKALMGEVEL